MIFTELDGTTREWMFRCFEAEESGGNPYRSEVLSPLGLARWPDLTRQAITDLDGNEVTLAASLNRPDYWRAADARGGRVNPAQASERLAITEFNTWYVAGLAARLQEEGATDCRVYRAGIPRWQAAGCSVHEGQTYAVAEIIAGHRVGYWPSPGVPGRLSIPAGPGCHHTIERVAALSRPLAHRRRAWGAAGRFTHCPAFRRQPREESQIRRGAAMRQHLADISPSSFRDPDSWYVQLASSQMYQFPSVRERSAHGGQRPTQ